MPEEDGLRRGKRRTKSESAYSNGNITPALPVPTIPNLQCNVSLTVLMTEDVSVSHGKDYC